MKNGCEFCKTFNFATARVKMNKFHTCIELALCNTKFPKKEQFKYCPMCGRKLSDKDG